MSRMVKSNKIFLISAIIIALALITTFVYKFSYDNYIQYKIVTYGDAKAWIEKNQKDLDLIIKYAHEKEGYLDYYNGKFYNYHKLDNMNEKERQILIKPAKRLRVIGFNEGYSKDGDPFMYIQFRIHEKNSQISGCYYDLFYFPKENVGELFGEITIPQISNEEWDNNVPENGTLVKIMDNWYLGYSIYIV